MKYLQSLLLALAAAQTAVYALPGGLESRQTSVNPFLGKEIFANKGYARKLEATISAFQNAGDSLNAARTRTVQKIGTFSWISNSADISTIAPLIADATEQQRITGRQQLVQLVVYNLPERDCSAKASDGEFHLNNDGFNKYKNYIDRISADLSTPAARALTFAVILEPDGLANLVTNLHIPKCNRAQQAYLDGVAYAISKLQQSNVHLYLDSAHGGWLGWSDNLPLTGGVFAEVLRRAAPNNRIRGVAINVSNYNQYNATVREPYTEWNDSWDERRFANNLAPHLTASGVPAHFIIDQGRSGKTGIRDDWSWWCNLKGAGYGPRPTTQTNDPIVDALVWVKPGGESDGTSDRTAVRFDENCV
ncbi:hypothetical protein AX16_006710, partial [Volvariella volvacea WC 439]